MKRWGEAFILVGIACITMTTLAACAANEHGQEHNVTTSHRATSSAKAEWRVLSEQVAQTQSIVGGTWESVDTSARQCSEDGAQWAITRIGPGVSATERDALMDRVERAWAKNGWKPARTHITGDAPGLQLRFPAGGFDDRRFFIELGSTVHGTTIQAQTPCAPGDVDQLNREQFAYNHMPGIAVSPAPTGH
jgi:hypothetical protein